MLPKLNRLTTVYKIGNCLLELFIFTIMPVLKICFLTCNISQRVTQSHMVALTLVRSTCIWWHPVVKLIEGLLFNELMVKLTKCLVRSQESSWVILPTVWSKNRFPFPSNSLRWLIDQYLHLDLKYSKSPATILSVGWRDGKVCASLPAVNSQIWIFPHF